MPPDIFYIWELLIIRVMQLHNRITEAQSKKAGKIAELLVRAGSPRKHTVEYIKEQWTALKLPERKRPSPRLNRAFRAISKLQEPIVLTDDEKLRVEYHDINGRETPHKSSLALSSKALHSGTIARGRMNFYLYGNLDLIAGQMVTLPRVPLRIPGKRAIMLIAQELGSQQNPSATDSSQKHTGNLAEKDEPMEVQQIQGGAAPDREQGTSQDGKGPHSPKASTPGTQPFMATAPVSVFLSQEARDLEFEISQEVLDELTQERENEIFSLVTWDTGSCTNEEEIQTPTLPELAEDHEDPE